MLDVLPLREGGSSGQYSHDQPMHYLHLLTSRTMHDFTLCNCSGGLSTPGIPGRRGRPALIKRRHTDSFTFFFFQLLPSPHALHRGFSLTHHSPPSTRISTPGPR